MKITPKKGFKGLIENWQSDLIAAISVSLVALPLGLGIAIASGVSPIAGITSAIIGGLVTTFIRGSHIAINGPTAGLIAVVLTAIEALEDGSGNTLNYVFAAIFIAGCLQVVLGLLRFGKFADLFHSTVVHGILAAIGVIIFVTQIHYALGTPTESRHILNTLMDVFHEFEHINPFVAIISLVGLLLLIFHSKISYKFFQFLPAPMWVLIISIPFVYAFNFFEPHTIQLLGKGYEVGPSLLINIPDNILDAVMFPNFSKIDTWPFWAAVLSITIIASIESLASAKAIDKLDPYKRKTNLNKDLVGVGFSTMIAGAIGGLPIINVIVRSTVNVHNYAKTKWSNFFHGVLILLFIFLLSPVIQKVPLAALAILLVYTGFKLASPKVFKHVYSQGVEQLIFFVGTLIITLMTDLLIGIFGGLLLALITHFLLVKVSIGEFFRMIFKPGTSLIEKEDGSYLLQVKGIANFLATIKIDDLLNKIPEGKDVTLDFSKAKLVDFSIQEHFNNFKRNHISTGGAVAFTGLDEHRSSSGHRLALKISKVVTKKLSPRQLKLKKMAASNNWNFDSDPAINNAYYETFHFFKTRPIEKSYNKIELPDNDYLNFVDIKFEEGGYIFQEEYKTTVALIKFSFPLPKFTIEKKEFPEKFLNLWKHKDIDYFLYDGFSRKFIVKVEQQHEMASFLNPEFKKLIEHSKIIHHLESNGESILLFTDNLKLASINEYAEMVSFAEKLQKIVLEQKGT